MTVFITCKFDKDPIKHEGAIPGTTFSPLYVYGKKFCCSRASNCDANIPIRPEIEHIQDFMTVSVTFKFWGHKLHQTDSLSKNFTFIHQTVFNIQDKITSPWNIGHVYIHSFSGQRLNHTDSLSKSLMIIHQIVFKTWGKSLDHEILVHFINLIPMHFFHKSLHITYPLLFLSFTHKVTKVKRPYKEC